jgi:hypothetical protein
MKFDLGTILSITDGHLLTDIGNVYKILDFMTGESNFTHQLPRVGRECRPVILAQHPELSSFDGDGITPENARDVLDEAIKKYGNEFEIAPLENYKHVDAIAELGQLLDNRKPVMIETPDFSELKEMVQQYIDDVSEGKYIDTDIYEYVFECAVETFFGKGVWDYINSSDE